MLERHPEELILEAERRDVHAALQNVLHDIFVLQHDTYRIITERYQAEFGLLEQELQRATLANAEMQRRVELFSVRKAKGHSLDADLIRFVNDMVTREFTVYHESLAENFDQTTEQRNARRKAPERVAAPGAAPELRRLYRELVRKLHPDLNTEQQSFERFWLMVRDAYERQDLQRLRLLHNVICTDADFSIQEDDTKARLDALAEQNLRLRMRLDYEQRKLMRLRTEEPFSLESMLNDDERRRGHAAEITKRIDKLRRSVRAGEAVLREMLGNDWDLSSPDLQAKEQPKDFQEEFRMNTYFSMRA